MNITPEDKAQLEEYARQAQKPATTFVTLPSVVVESAWIGLRSLLARMKAEGLMHHPAYVHFEQAADTLKESLHG